MVECIVLLLAIVTVLFRIVRLLCDCWQGTGKAVAFRKIRLVVYAFIVDPVRQIERSLAAHQIRQLFFADLERNYGQCFTEGQENVILNHPEPGRAEVHFKVLFRLEHFELYVEQCQCRSIPIVVVCIYGYIVFADAGHR
uniref:Putative secreted peptide n=1 Tax=Anopheles braziliensis TaxID=58242 RepID=A0A2M3ZRU0_9DIPT